MAAITEACSDNLVSHGEVYNFYHRTWFCKSYQLHETPRCKTNYYIKLNTIGYALYTMLRFS